MSVLGPVQFSTAAQVLESAALRVALRHAGDNKRERLEAVSVLLARHVWPECLPANLGHDYPAPDASLDRWVRAGFVHGTLDSLCGLDSRPARTGITDEHSRSYLIAYLAGRYGMTPT